MQEILFCVRRDDEEEEEGEEKIDFSGHLFHYYYSNYGLADLHKNLSILLAASISDISSIIFSCHVDVFSSFYRVSLIVITARLINHVFFLLLP